MKKIMVVEDKQYYHDLYISVLKNTDYEIVCTYDGNEAMERLDEVKPDLVILDMLLDKIAGDTFFRLIRNMPEYADLPFIIVSGYPERAIEILKDLNHNLTFLDKTEVCEKLVEKINNAIG